MQAVAELTSIITDWWARDDLFYCGEKLRFGGECLEALAKSVNQPVYVYNGQRARQNLHRLNSSLEHAGLRAKIFFALKCNRFMPFLTMLKGTGMCGVDAASPREILWAKQCGFKASEIIYTNTSVSNGDIDTLERNPEVVVNCDSLSAIRRLGQRCPGRKIGIRINPERGLGYRSNPLLQYAGEQATKFGILGAQFREALHLAQEYHLEVIGLHFHAGCGYLTPQLTALDQVFERVQWFIDQVPNLHFLDIGGGLGIPLVEDDLPLDLQQWSQLVAEHFGDRGFEIWLEPGDYIAKDCGVLVLQVTTVEFRAGRTLIGVNGGFNLAPEPVFYNLPMEILPCHIKQDKDAVDHAPKPVTVVGNINEALDVWAKNIQLNYVEEGDYLAFLNGGGYAASMSSNHCLRGEFIEILI